ncbi:unnamed protein product, partial [Mesorhabditis spiculigera]
MRARTMRSLRSLTSRSSTRKTSDGTAGGTGSRRPTQRDEIDDAVKLNFQQTGSGSGRARAPPTYSALPQLVWLNVFVSFTYIWHVLKVALWVRFVVAVLPSEDNIELPPTDGLKKCCSRAVGILSTVLVILCCLQFVQIVMVMITTIRRSVETMKLSLLTQVFVIYVDLVLALICTTYALRKCYTLYWPTVVAWIQLVPSIVWAVYVSTWFGHVEAICYKIRNPSMHIEDYLSLGTHKETASGTQPSDTSTKQKETSSSRKTQRVVDETKKEK